MAKQTQDRRGQLIDKGPGKWLLRIYLGREMGKKKYSSKTVTGTRRQAERELSAMLADQDKGVYVPPAKSTLQEYLEQWLDTKTDLAESTAAEYRSRMALDVYPFLGGKRLDSVKPEDIAALYAKLQQSEKKGGRGISPTTIIYTHRILSQALKAAVRWDILHKNPCEYVTLPKKEHTEMQIMSPETAAEFLEGTKGDPDHALWWVLLSTGMRPGEALALKWEDYDGTTLKVRRGLEKLRKGGYIVTAPKTEKSKRTLGIPEGAREALQAHKVAQAELRLAQGPRFKDQGWIFVTRTGNHHSESNVLKRWKRSLKALGLPVVRMYDARHTHATHLLDAGFHAKAVADRLGHTDVNLLLNTYTHTRKEVHEAMGEAAGDILTRRAAM